eukprot:Hpha_TRINITY_DN16191_c5_g1::TRINITY_DN16191_c5_g1_i2::g.4925::m.4925
MRGHRPSDPYPYPMPSPQITPQSSTRSSRSTLLSERDRVRTSGDFRDLPRHTQRYPDSPSSSTTESTSTESSSESHPNHVVHTHIPNKDTGPGAGHGAGPGYPGHERFSPPCLATPAGAAAMAERVDSGELPPPPPPPRPGHGNGEHTPPRSRQHPRQHPSPSPAVPGGVRSSSPQHRDTSVRRRQVGIRASSPLSSSHLAPSPSRSRSAVSGTPSRSRVAAERAEAEKCPFTPCITRLAHNLASERLHNATVHGLTNEVLGRWEERTYYREAEAREERRKAREQAAYENAWRSEHTTDDLVECTFAPKVNKGGIVQSTPRTTDEACISLYQRAVSSRSIPPPPRPAPTFTPRLDRIHGRAPSPRAKAVNHTESGERMYRDARVQQQNIEDARERLRQEQHAKMQKASYSKDVNRINQILF